MDDLRYLAQRLLSSAEGLPIEPTWETLLCGGWAIVDQFDDDDRRIVIACRDPRAKGLSTDELLLVRRRARGESLKVLAYDLGISVSAVSRRLSNAMRKLGIKAHAELPRLFGVPVTARESSSARRG